MNLSWYLGLKEKQKLWCRTNLYIQKTDNNLDLQRTLAGSYKAMSLSIQYQFLMARLGELFPNNSNHKDFLQFFQTGLKS